MTGRRWIRFALLGLVGLATLEVLARLEDWWRDGASPLGSHSIEDLFRPSPTGREGVPHARFGKWRMNGLGFRGEEPAAGRETVLAFGASETFGQYESPGHEYPRLLADELEARAPGRYDVQNGALPGMRVGRIAYLEQALDRARPRYLVIYPSPVNYVGIERPLCTQPARPVPAERRLADRLRVVGKIDQLAKRVVPPEAMTALREADLWWTTRNLTVVPRVPEETIRAFATDLECAVDAAVAHGAVPVLVTHATYFGGELRPGDRPWLVAWRRFYPTLAEDGFMDLERRANDAVRELARRRRLPLFDAARAVPRGPASFADFVHFTDRGAGSMASGLADVISGVPARHAAGPAPAERPIRDSAGASVPPARGTPQGTPPAL